MEKRTKNKTELFVREENSHRFSFLHSFWDVLLILLSLSSCFVVVVVYVKKCFFFSHSCFNLQNNLWADGGGSCSFRWCVKATSFVVNETRLLILVLLLLLAIHLQVLIGLLKLLVIQFDVIGWDQQIGAFWLRRRLGRLADVSRCSQLIVSDAVVGWLALVLLWIENKKKISVFVQRDYSAFR